ncbi:hypothetical protein evm_013687 [Chilo suppressalis]|nr:hypothetical protein evm_013687 [Chilo suppressalis]
MSLTVAEEAKLIKLVSKHPILYDTKHADHRNSFIREETWKIIEQKLGKSNETLKKKWKLIRDTYQRYKRNTMSKTGYKTTKKFRKRYQMLSFLDDKAGGLNTPESSFESQRNLPEKEMKVEDDSSDDNYDQKSSNHSDFSDENSERERTPEKKLKRSMNDEEFFKYWQERFPNRENELKRIINKNEDDDVDLFCRHIEKVLRSLPPVYKAKAKKEIGILVSDYEIKAAQMSAPESGRALPGPSGSDAVSNSKLEPRWDPLA